MLHNIIYINESWWVRTGWICTDHHGDIHPLLALPPGSMSRVGPKKKVIRDCCFVNIMNTLANLDVTSVKHHSEIGVIFTNAIGGLTLIHIVHVYPYKSVRFSQPDGAKLEIMLVFPQKQNINQSTITGWWFGTWILFFHILGISSSQLTSCPSFFRGVGLKPPTRSTFINHHQPSVSISIHHFSLPHQWEFQDPKLEGPTIYKAYIRPM